MISGKKTVEIIFLQKSIFKTFAGCFLVKPNEIYDSFEILDVLFQSIFRSVGCSKMQQILISESDTMR